MVTIEMLRARLHDFDKNIFTDEQLQAFLNIGEMLTKSQYVEQEHIDDAVFHAATANALLSQALIEAGKPSTIIDNGISFTPPDLSGALTEQAMIEYELFLGLEAERVEEAETDLDELFGNLNPVAVDIGDSDPDALLRSLQEILGPSVVAVNKVKDA